ncbi:phage tail-collar fiber domain-containing protein [Porcincola intestinalis]|uniref:Phage tail fibre protein N-terminal domain-containing protein n=1 Tax=Porcincola intestinalis TaxID=2606632 RepID=A0A6L5X3R7_9FIRM|nr:phage tail protein [Porcincola intestinalis]MSS13626.1 hypothetical protein [Porcincola intestinalis]
MAETIVSTVGKSKMLKARAGIQALPAIEGVAFGSGGVNSSGEIKNHASDDTALFSEVLRKKVDGHEVISDTQIRYTCTLSETELNDVSISEIGLYDTDGDIVAFKSFKPKVKDSGEELIFQCDDEF